MAIWQDFEYQCTRHLTQQYGNKAQFISEGGSDSTISDIKVITNNNNIFYIEAKHSPSQCGQFVLLPDIETQSFTYSHLNTTPINTYSSIITEHMKTDFDAYKESGTKGKEIVFDGCEKVFANWVMDHYRNKGVKFIITNDFTIFPLENFSDYFNIAAKYRVKRSGSSSVGKANTTPVMDYITSNYDVISTNIDNTKLFVNSTKHIHDTRFRFDSYEYMFSQRNEQYEIRKLSNTFNANVIFSITLKSTQNISDLEKFEAALF